MGDFANNFRARFEADIEASEYRSERSLAKAAGVSHNQIASMRKPPKTTKDEKGPGLFVTAKVAQTLEKSVDDWLGLNEFGQPSFEGLVRRWALGGKTMSDFEDVQDYLTVFVLPKRTDTKLEISFLGKKSLAFRETFLKSRWAFQEAMNLFGSAEDRERIIGAYAELDEKGIDLSLQVMDVPRLGQMMKPVSIEYQRLLLLVSDQEGKPKVLSYAIQI